MWPWCSSPICGWGRKCRPAGRHARHRRRENIHTSSRPGRRRCCRGTLANRGKGARSFVFLIVLRVVAGEVAFPLAGGFEGRLAEEHEDQSSEDEEPRQKNRGEE